MAAAAPADERSCDMPGCLESGCYRAPKARDRLDDYYWFCLTHVRAYNSAWDYCSGMTIDEIEAMIRRDTTWQRPSWRFGDWIAREKSLREDATRACDPRAYRRRGAGASAGHHEHQGRRGDDSFGAGRRDAPPGDDHDRTAQASRQSAEIQQALRLFELTPPVDIDTIKTRYRELAKRHHPDANGGSRTAEEHLKRINQAYALLKAWHGG